MRLLDTRKVGAASRQPRKTSNPALWVAVFSGCGVLLCGLLLLSPFLRVTTVVWTGSVLLDEERCEQIESLCLGQSLFLLPHTRLQASGDASDHLQIYFKKHFPNTLEVAVSSRLAVARTSRGEALDLSGRVLGVGQADPSLPELRGFVIDNEQLSAAGVRVVQALRPLLALPALRPASAQREGDDVTLVLARSATRVVARIGALDAQLSKLRVYEQSLGTDELPETIDLRFRQQVVVRAAAGGTHEDG